MNNETCRIGDIRRMEGNAKLSTMKITTALFFGFLLGTAAGLIGVGGGEFRIPILLYVLGLSVVTAIAVNLLVGLLTVIASFARRFQLGLFNEKAINVAIFMVIGSIVGAYIGAFLTSKIPEKPLKQLLAVFLIVVGLKIGLEPFIETPAFFTFTFDPLLEIVFAVLLGIAIGIISGSLGVAGGEFRIPVLIYLFGFDIIVAGTASLLVSMPTVAMGFTKHHSMGHTNHNATVLAVIMGVGSIVGALLGASMVGNVDHDVLKVLLGVMLILATVRMLTKP